MTNYCPQHGYPLPCDKCGYSGSNTNLFDLTGKIALVTGKSGMLAPVWVETLKNAGCKVYCGEPPELDVTNKGSIDSFWLKHNQFIPDIICNSAAIDNPPTSKATFFGNAKEIIDVNLLGALNICDYFIPKMIVKGGGVIVNIGSIQGWLGADWRNYEGDFEKPFGYNASKWALRGLAKSISVQYGRYNIRCVTPSFSAYDGGKLDPVFLEKFLKNVPMGRAISKKSMQTTLLYCVCCPELSGADWLVDAGYSSW
jgi:NAD(P)-dependent dehydrogenase (short-subunit alcohol dehydrogenase family)